MFRLRLCQLHVEDQTELQNINLSTFSEPTDYKNTNLSEHWILALVVSSAPSFPVTDCLSSNFLNFVGTSVPVAVCTIITIARIWWNWMPFPMIHSSKIQLCISWHTNTILEGKLRGTDKRKWIKMLMVTFIMKLKHPNCWHFSFFLFLKLSLTCQNFQVLKLLVKQKEATQLSCHIYLYHINIDK